MGNTIRVLLPDNVTLANAGVNIEMIQDGLLQVVAGSWLNMAVGDQVTVYASATGNALANAEVTAAMVDNDVRLSIQANALTDGVMVLHHGVTRIGGGGEELSDPIQVVVKRTRPGGRDPVSGAPGHQGLVLPPLPDPIDASHLLRGLTLTLPAYLDMRVRDMVTLGWGTARLHRLVEADEVGKPLTFHVPGEFIAQAGDQPGMEVRYSVTDELENQSRDGDNLPWSATQIVDVQAGNRPQAPWIEQANDQHVLDVDELAGANPLVMVLLDAFWMSVGDTVRLFWEGRDAQGRPTTAGPWPQEVRQTSGTLAFEVENAHARALAQGSVTLSYEIIKPGASHARAQPAQQAEAGRATVQDPTPSRKRIVPIIGHAEALAPPVVREAVGGVLSPYLPAATLLLAYAGIAEGDRLEIRWTGQVAGSTPVELLLNHVVTWRESLARQVVRTVDSASIRPFNTGTLIARYSVKAHGQERFSDAVRLRVYAALPSLPAPTVVEAEEGYLDMTLVPSYGATLAMPYTVPPVQAGDRIIYTWAGEVTGPYSDSTYLSAPVVPPAQLRIPYDEISGNLTRTAHVHYRIERANQLVALSETAEVLIGSLELSLPAPRVLKAQDGRLDPLLVQGGATLRVQFDLMLPIDRIRAVWDVVDQGVEQPGNDQHLLDFVIAPSEIIRTLGRSIEARYLVRRGRREFESGVVMLDVGALTEQNLPMPTISEAVGDVLDVAALLEDANLTVSRWPFGAAGQRLWLTLEGRQINGTPLVITLASNSAVTESEARQGLARKVSQTQLNQLADGTDLTITMKVSLDASTDEQRAQLFPRRVLRIRQQPPLDLAQPRVPLVVNGKLDPYTVAASGAVVHVNPYGGLVNGDRVTATWKGTGDVYVTPVNTVANDQVPDFSIPREQVRASADQRVNVFYTVRRFIGATVQNSPALSFDVLPLVDLPAPIVPLASQGQLDPERVPASGLVVQVLDYNNINDGDSVELVVTGSGANWTSPVRHPSGQTLADFLVPQTIVFANAGRDARFTYRVARAAGGSAVTSEALDLHVMARLDLAPPAVPQAVGNAVDPYVVTAGVTVRITATGLINGDSVVVLFGNDRTPAQTATGGGVADFSISKAWVDRYQGQTIAVRYGVTRGSGAEALSRVLNLRVLPLFNLGTPRVPLASGGTLSPGSVPNSGCPVQVDAYTGMGQGDSVLVAWNTSNSGAQTVQTPGTLTFTFSKALVESHANQTVTLVYRVTRSGITHTSNALSLRIGANIPPLIIDTTPLRIGNIYRMNGVPPNPPAGSYGTRTASGGQPPYTYSISDAGVADLLSNGRVIAKRSGNATVTVRDARGSQASYTVNVSSVYMFFQFDGWINYQWAVQAAAAQGGVIPSLAQWDAVRSSYHSQMGISVVCWTSDIAPGIQQRWGIVPDSGARQKLWDFGIGGHTAFGWGMKGQ